MCQNVQTEPLLRNCRPGGIITKSQPYFQDPTPVNNQQPDSRFHGVMVSTLDFESSDPSSNLGGTFS